MIRLARRVADGSAPQWLVTIHLIRVLNLECLCVCDAFVLQRLVNRCSCGTDSRSARQVGAKSIPGPAAEVPEARWPSG